MKKSLLLLLLAQTLFCFSQDLKLPVTKTFSEKLAAESYIGSDGLGNIYYITNNILFKKNESDLWQYKNPFLGKITRVDLQNPLKIMVLYGEFNTVILLDSQLNESEKIDFSKNETPIVATSAGMASQNKLWIFNSLSQQIGLYDYLNDTFKTLTQSFQGGLKYYETDFNNFQWIDDQLNWKSCTVFGKIIPIDKVPEFDQIQLIDSQIIIFSKNGQVYAQNFKNDKIYMIENIEKSFKSFYYKDQILSIFTSSEISFYKITLP